MEDNTIENPEMDTNYRYRDGSYLASFHWEFVEFSADEDPFESEED